MFREHVEHMSGHSLVCCLHGRMRIWGKNKQRGEELFCACEIRGAASVDFRWRKDAFQNASLSVGSKWVQHAVDGIDAQHERCFHHPVCCAK